MYEILVGDSVNISSFERKDIVFAGSRVTWLQNEVLIVYNAISFQVIAYFEVARARRWLDRGPWE
jgi:hypothetical protein